MKSITKCYLVFFTLSVSLSAFSQAPFITTWQTDNPGTSCNTCITIPTHPDETYNYEIDWDNDGVYEESGVSGDVTHDFGVERTYTIALRGEFPRIYFNREGDKEKIINIDQWGDIEWSSMASAFYGCENLNSDASDVPNLENVTSLNRMFRFARSFNHNIGGWDVSNITDMSFLFSFVSSFDQDISSWDVSKVENMSHMFSYAELFNQPLGNWDISSVTSMNSMFNGTEEFDQDIGDWNVSNVTDMEELFSFSDKFNQNIENWDVSNLTSTNSMFRYAARFDQPLAGWDVSNVTNMAMMFEGTNNFNQPIEDWDVSNVTNMERMFDSSFDFNQSLNEWNVSNVENMESMFGSTFQFNQSIDEWDVSNVETMKRMFSIAQSFNQDISGWDISSVNNMENMFAAARFFNQDISNWDVSNIDTIGAMFINAKAFDQDLGNWQLSPNAILISQSGQGFFQISGMSCESYSNTIYGWAQNPNTPTNRDLGPLTDMEHGMGAEEARDYLINELGWIMNGDTLGECTTLSASNIEDSELYIYPNPVTSEMNIANVKTSQYSIHNINGQVLLSGQFENAGINVQRLLAGIYVLKIVDAQQQVYIKKFVKK